MDFGKKAADNLRSLREQNPLIHNITNYVVMNFSANSLLAMGAQPVMAHAESEVEQMAAIAGALVINIGTLSIPWVRAMFLAAKTAHAYNIPIVLDPVGSGATRLRTDTSRRMVRELKLAAVRGNASEILSLADEDIKTRGVDSIHSVDEAAQAAALLARSFKTVVAITGKIDLVTDGEKIYKVCNGHELMRRVTGTGCIATAAIAAFCAVNQDFLEATACALGYFGLAGEKAAEKHFAPGSYKVGLVDALYEITPEQLQAGIRIEA